MAQPNNGTIILTGAKGYIGSHLLERLSKDVNCIDLKDGLDASDEKSYPKEKQDIIVHLAAHLQPEDDSDIKLHRTVLEMAKRWNAHVIYASSAAIYEPNTLYAIQKLYGEVLFKDYGILRFFNVYGDGGHGIVDIIKNHTNETIQVNGNGEQTRDYVHVEDVVSAIKKAIDIKWTGTAEIGTGIETSVNELMEMSETLDFEYVNKDPGILKSVAKLNPLFPWKHTLGLK
jgi:UDP-glucose 4-epimerase